MTRGSSLDPRSDTVCEWAGDGLKSSISAGLGRRAVAAGAEGRYQSRDGRHCCSPCARLPGHRPYVPRVDSPLAGISCRSGRTNYYVTASIKDLKLMRL